ncbi:MAG: 2,3-diphosphoglycerate-dependent phosphoglycerate mutase [Oceanicaulis sp.]|uniref:2,3-diphosphoglycerate-dependent phosphoglycerate mutase n=1 Tax=Glycocaulis sp. TaxID=1969725 RepID=UPI0025C71F79|nr:2,3-diphosphoglycerate-dependent phosphoglycerate mutase [Glycocaulis sp.]MCC5981428.1 2,3-diphosphoglycerate-dependent phosphoglycerate mutase [Oceanicaulis sp.]MCH8521746.1 2,3-diphosphoglycerate-dependent phosphoglycerate mutase [Glycocaulis sp.]
MTRLVLTRHGQSQWNLENRFTGWVDVNLTERGEGEARRGGELMKAEGFAPDIVFTSYLKRAIRTVWLGLEAMDRVWTPVINDWRLNERHYGALTGLNKAETVAAHGEDQVLVWRRSFDVPPPPLDPSDERHPSHDPRYAGLDPALLPATESLKETLVRVQPCFDTHIAPRLKGGESVLISAHGNSLRALVKILFDVSDGDILKVEVPTGNPLLIELDGLTPVSARYLDEARAEALPPCPAR